MDMLSLPLFEILHPPTHGSLKILRLFILFPFLLNPLPPPDPNHATPPFGLTTPEPTPENTEDHIPERSQQPEHRYSLDTRTQQLINSFSMRDLGELHWFLNIRIIRDRPARRLWLCQDSYVDSLAHDYPFVAHYPTPLTYHIPFFVVSTRGGHPIVLGRPCVRRSSRGVSNRTVPLRVSQRCFPTCARPN